MIDITVSKPQFAKKDAQHTMQKVQKSLFKKMPGVFFAMIVFVALVQFERN